MQSKTKITAAIVSHIATLAQIPVSEEESEDLATGFTKVLEVIDKLGAIDTAGVEPVGQVTGLENVTRTDEVQKEHMFCQEEALRNAKRVHNGYFVVDQVLDK